LNRETPNSSVTYPCSSVHYSVERRRLNQAFSPIFSVRKRHRFYTDFYMHLNKRNQTAVELLLFVMGKREAKADPELERVYEQERAQWSIGLNTVLHLLDEIAPLEDSLAAKHEAMETASA